MDVKIGDRFKIHCYKHNGQIFRSSDEAIVVDVLKDHIVIGNKQVMITKSDGRRYRTKELAFIYFYKNRWFNIIAQLKKRGLYYYCNLSSPYIIEDGTIKYIDYDLDLRVYPDGKHRVLDRAEYQRHKKEMEYPEEIDKIIQAELASLIEMAKAKGGPFGDHKHEFYNKRYQELSNN